MNAKHALALGLILYAPHFPAKPDLFLIASQESAVALLHSFRSKNSRLELALHAPLAFTLALEWAGGGGCFCLFIAGSQRLFLSDYSSIVTKWPGGLIRGFPCLPCFLQILLFADESIQKPLHQKSE